LQPRPTEAVRSLLPNPRLESQLIQGFRRFGGMHFFARKLSRIAIKINVHAILAVPSTQLVEVVRTDKITEEAYATLVALGKRLRNQVLPCADIPGWVKRFPLRTSRID